jgi:predicted AlkP superfamily phosphohydrolase/phosphomutase
MTIQKYVVKKIVEIDSDKAYATGYNIVAIACESTEGFEIIEFEDDPLWVPEVSKEIKRLSRRINKMQRD